MYTLLRASDATRNRLLCALPRTELEPLLPHLQPVTFSLGQVIYEPGERIDFCYFPIDCVIAMLYTTREGTTAEIGLVGHEGVLGVPLFLGGDSTCSRALVPIAGDAVRLPARLLLEEFAHAGPLQHSLLRYALTLINQISQTAVCNRLHSVEQRLCRLLLMCDDRKNRSELHMTQELIANMLGGRRESVTVAAGHLQDADLIHYCRGHITILDRVGLEAAACECYRIVEDESARPFGSKRKPEASGPGGVFEATG
jgi:CRP-like cAMP-binding protein